MAPTPTPGPIPGRNGGSQAGNDKELVSLLKSIQKTLCSLDNCSERELKTSLQEVNKGINKAIQLAEPPSLRDINTKLDQILYLKPTTTFSPAFPASYASVTAQNLPPSARTAYSPPQPLQPPRHFSAIFRAAETSPLRVNGVTAKEILIEIRKEFTGVIAATPLPSGQIRVSFLTQKEKDTALVKATSRDLQGSFQQEMYPIEVLSFPLSIPVDCEKGAKNEELVTELEAENTRIYRAFQVHKISWIHGKKSTLPRPNGYTPRSASLVVYLKNKDAQKAAVLSGVSFRGQLFRATIYDRSLQIPRCYNCNRWGHTQGHCRSTTRCGFCSGPHGTRECNRKPEEQKCPNCQKEGHSSWEKAKCNAYSYREGYRAILRATLDQRAAQWDSEERAKEVQNLPQSSQFSYTPNKRPRPAPSTSTSTSAAPRRRGAPTLAERLQNQQQGQTTLFNMTLDSSEMPSSSFPFSTQSTQSPSLPEDEPTDPNPWN